jgi:hypothetical protein
MGKIKQGILGGFSGKVANVVGSSWKGIPVMKSLPLSVANPRSPAQVAQRSSFSEVVNAASAILAVIVKPLWDRFAHQMSGFNSFIQSNIDAFADAAAPVFADIIISKGAIEEQESPAYSTGSGSDTVRLEWDDSVLGAYQLGSDIAYIAVFDVTSDKWFANSDGADRSDCEISCKVGQNLSSGQIYHLYLAFRRADGTLASETSYVTKEIT